MKMKEIGPSTPPGSTNGIYSKNTTDMKSIEIKLQMNEVYSLTDQI